MSAKTFLHKVFILASVFTFFVSSKVAAQIMATAAQKAKALYITQQKVDSSEARREEKNNTTGDEIKYPDDYAYKISGPDKVDRYSEQGYNCEPKAPLTGWWYVSSGTVVNYYDDLITIDFTTSASTVEIMLFDEQDYLLSRYVVTVLGDYNPLSAGKIETGSQAINAGGMPVDIKCTAAEGGACNGNYTYQWEYSDDGKTFYEIEEQANGIDYIFEGPVYSTTYFRRKVRCSLDSQYTGAVGVFVNPLLHGGTIPKLVYLVDLNQNIPNVNATPAQYGDCSTYNYQWEIAKTGGRFEDFDGQNAENFTGVYSVIDNMLLRRRVQCDTQVQYTNTVIIKIKDSLVSSAPPQTSIDTALAMSGINLSVLFNLGNDAQINERPAPDPAMDSLIAIGVGSSELMAFENGAKDDSLFNAIRNQPSVDSVDQWMAAVDSGMYLMDSTPVFMPMITDSVIQAYRSAGNYQGLDSLVRTAHTVTIENSYVPIQTELNRNVPEPEQNFLPPTVIWALSNTAVINGPSIVRQGFVYHYTGSFYFTPNTSSIRWIAVGGQIISQNTNPSTGPLYVDVKWSYSSTQDNYLVLSDMGTNQSALHNAYLVTGSGYVYPAMQAVMYGQTPCLLQSKTFFFPQSLNLNFQYSWQKLDYFTAGSTWQDIPGSNSSGSSPGAVVSFQPAPQENAWLFYRLKVSLFSNGAAMSTYYSSAASINVGYLNPRALSTPVNHIQYNTAPQINETQAYGGMLTAGATYNYVWEASVNDGPWQQIGTGQAYPSSYVLTAARVAIRRKVNIINADPNVYNLPNIFWEAVSQPLQFTTFYRSVDYENRNYIRENGVLTRGVDTYIAADMLPSEKKAQTTTYLDGLSRPVQIVGKATSYNEQNGQWTDLVQQINYEAGGRVDKSLLPYATIDNPGKYKTNVATAQPAYYQAKFGDANAFAKVEYDNSPLNRVLKTYAPGDAWVGNNVNTSADIQLPGAQEMVRYLSMDQYSPGTLPTNRGMMLPNFFYKSYSKDEKGKDVYTYTDLSGNVILKKVQLAETPGQGHEGYLCTYYVYDAFNQQRFIITPKAVEALDQNGWVFTQAIADELCYWYDYDELGRVTAKKTPGKAAENIVYDSRNRPVFSQDAGIAMSEPGDPILTTLYDELNRPVLTGLLFNRTMAEWGSFTANTPNTITVFNSTQGGTIKIWGSPLLADQLSDPATFRALSFTYYDDYGYAGAKTFNAAHINNLAYKNSSTQGNVEPTDLSSRSRGMATGSKTRVLISGTTQFLTSTVFYDEKGKVIQSQEDNIKNAVDITSIQYHFDGRVISASETQTNSAAGITNFNILTKYKFSKDGKLTGIGKKINDVQRSYAGSINVTEAQEDADAGYKITAAYKYDELGRRIQKKLSPGYNSGAGLETLDYSYNIRGWLTGINKDYALGEYNTNQWQHYFGIYIGYDNRDGKFAAAQYNGSITGVIWKSQGDNTPRKFDYSYDNANRLTSAMFNQRGTSSETWNRAKVDFSTKDLSYDANGNLLNLTHMGVLPATATPVMIDQLTYSYGANTNKLLKVTDNGTAGSANGKSGDIKDGDNTPAENDYDYDAQGRQIFDKNRRVSNVVYNYLDKPELITVQPPAGQPGGGTIKYVYDAGGSKLQKIVTENPAPANNNQQRIITTSYIASFIYEQVTVGSSAQPEALQVVLHEEGRIRVITPYSNPSDPANYIGGGITLPNGKQGVFDYFIKDNLYNVRAIVTEEINKAGSVCSMEDANTQTAQYEEGLFGNPGSGNEVASTRINRPPAWTSATVLPGQTSNQRVSVLQAVGGQPATGPNVLLRVMAGDVIGASVEYYYQTDPGSGGGNSGLTAMLNSFGATLSGGRTGVDTKVGVTQVTNSLNINGALAGLFSNPPPGSSTNENAPRAWLNYIFLDEQFNFVAATSGCRRVSQAGDGADPIAITNIKAVKNGYVYVYLTNESGTAVYFDNFAVTHQRGQLIEDAAYYAYGLKIAGISSKAVSSSLNPAMPGYGYQGSFAEEVEDFELNYNEFELRTYDPQIGRWTSTDPYDEFASPYLGMGNDPVNNVDPSGGNIWGAIWSFFGGASGGAAAGTGFIGVGSACAAYGAAGATCSIGVTIVRTAMAGVLVGGNSYASAMSNLAGENLGPIGNYNNLAVSLNLTDEGTSSNNQIINDLDNYFKNDLFTDAGDLKDHGFADDPCTGARKKYGSSNCQELLAEMLKVLNGWTETTGKRVYGMKERYRDQLFGKDHHKPGGYPGHLQKYEEYRTKLNCLLQLYMEKGCGPPPDDVKEWSARQYPEPDAVPVQPKGDISSYAPPPKTALRPSPAPQSQPLPKPSKPIELPKISPPTGKQVAVGTAVVIIVIIILSDGAAAPILAPILL